MKPVTYELGWSHISHLPLADPGFGHPGRIDILLGADEIIGQGRRKGPIGSPTAFETDFGWVLCGQSPRLITYSGNSGKLKNHPLTKPPYLLRNAQWFVISSPITHVQRKEDS
jgi:hypothetical protein